MGVGGWIWDGLKAAFKGAVTFVEGLGKSIWDGFLVPIGNFFKDAGKAIWEGLKSVFSFSFLSGGDDNGGGGGGFFSKVGSGLSSAASAAGDFFSSPFNQGGIVPGFAHGGAVGSSDTVPAMLTPGEFVLNRSATSSLGEGVLNKMNSGQIPVSQNFNISLNIENTGQDLDEQFIRSRVIPATLDAIKRASIDGRFTIASQGIRQL